MFGPPRPTQPSRPASLRAAWVALTGLSAVFLVEMLDNSLLNLALPTIGRALRADAAHLQWVTAAYSVTFGTLMLVFGIIADRVGRRTMMLIGLSLLACASLATLAVTTAPQLIAVRALMGVAAAMTTPGSLALAFHLFDDDRLRVRATTLISTVGLVGLAVGPTLGGVLLVVVPWQALLILNAPVALLALACIALGVPRDRPADHGRTPMKLSTVLRPNVASGLAYKAAASIGVAGMGYLLTLQLQVLWGWTPAHAALGMLPQVVVLIGGGAVITPLLDRVGPGRAAWLSALILVSGLALYAVAGRLGYVAVAASLVLVAAGMRVVGVVAGTDVLRDLPVQSAGTGAALVDTVGELGTAIGVALAGSVFAAWFPGPLPDAPHPDGLGPAIAWAAAAIAAAAVVLVAWGYRRSLAADR